MLAQLTSLTRVTVESNSAYLNFSISNMLKQYHIKKALNLSAFFIGLIFYFGLSAQVANAKNCTSTQLSPPENVVVKWVYDGDTLLLTDKRKIRLIGIDTPEVKHHQQKEQAFGARAREALRELLARDHYRVQLRYGKERYDRYSRTLAHVFLRDGTNLSSWLLEKGYARTLAYPPNISLASCYRQTEHYAQAQKLRLWRIAANQPRDAASLPLNTKGYVRLSGRVKRIYRHKKSTTIELVSHNKHPIQLRIKKGNLGYFRSIVPDKLWNKEIIVSGILKNKRNKRVLYLNHPSQLEINQRNSAGIVTGIVTDIAKPKAARHSPAPSIKWSKQQ